MYLKLVRADLDSGFCHWIVDRLRVVADHAEVVAI